MTLADTVRANAIRTFEFTCRSTDHVDCKVIHYTTAMILTHGSDKAHRIGFSAHSSAPDKIYGDSGPACGSKMRGRDWIAAGRFVAAVTCGRCK